MSFKFLKRRYRILLLIGIAGTLFLCFQLFSFKVISISGRRQQESLRQARILDNDVAEQLDHEKLKFAPEKLVSSAKQDQGMDGAAIEDQIQDEKKAGSP